MYAWRICKKCKSEYYKQLKISQEGKIKTCSKCNFTGESIFFGKRGNVCKKCENLANKEKRNKKIEKEKGIEKTCYKCKFIGKEDLFVKGRNICKNCQIEYEKQLIKKDSDLYYSKELKSFFFNLLLPHFIHL